MERKKLSSVETDSLLNDLDNWRIKDEKLYKRFEFGDFSQSLSFVNKVGELAERADHHPDITFGWGYAEIELTTHDTSGLTRFDFSLAAKIDEVGK